MNNNLAAMAGRAIASVHGGGPDPGELAIAARIQWMHELSKAVEAGNEVGLMGIRVKGIRFRADGAMQVDTEQVQCLSICEGEAR